MDGPAETSPDRVEYATEPICFRTLYHWRLSRNHPCDSALHPVKRPGCFRSDSADQPQLAMFWRNLYEPSDPAHIRDEVKGRAVTERLSRFAGYAETR
jgi:hypothetical protein